MRSGSPLLPKLGVERLNAFSDGVFAIAATLLVLDLSTPDDLTPEQFRADLYHNIPSMLTYLLSFAVVGVFWVRHHQILSLARAVSPGLLLLNLLFLALIALIPFPTSLLGNYYDDPLAPAFYATVVGCADVINMGLMLFIGRRPDLRRPGLHPALVRAHLLRPGLSGLIAFASVPVAYLVSAGAAELTWLLLIPVRLLVSRHVHRRVASRADQEEPRR
ncbi:TMEM175 family protein [Actinocorallia libanotica]|uniref:TMEM175 family protein n=1 Tax=Actinocorallia libanotica TaxID=46162 RepID=A0ABP4ASR6_9ACTN